MPEMQKNIGVTNFISKIKRVETYPDFENLARVIQDGLRRFINQNTDDESMEANDLSHVL